MSDYIMPTDRKHIVAVRVDKQWIHGVAPTSVVFDEARGIVKFTARWGGRGSTNRRNFTVDLAEVTGWQEAVVYN